VRSKALFWLAQKAGNKQAQDVIKMRVRIGSQRKRTARLRAEAIAGEPGGSLLIDVARNNPDPAVREGDVLAGAIRDPRAVDSSRSS